MQAAGACGASTEGHTTMAAGQDATELLGYLSGGRQWAADELMPLVHEVYMKLVDQARVDWQSKTHFKAVAAQAMYRAPVDHARARNREKRGGTWRRVRLYDAFVLAGSHKKDLEPLSSRTPWRRCAGSMSGKRASSSCASSAGRRARRRGGSWASEPGRSSVTGILARPGFVAS